MLTANTEILSSNRDKSSALPNTAVAMDSNELRQLCLDCGADDVGFVSLDRPELDGETLPMSDDTFDSVVCTWTLCSIKNADQAMREVYRVLKPGGRFFFIEHGLSDEVDVQCWQNRLNPLQNFFTDGCHLNRDIKKIIEKPNFSNLKIENFYMENSPKTHSYLFVQRNCHKITVGASKNYR
jgi:SAM-dependent methyltransferase